MITPVRLQESLPEVTTNLTAPRNEDVIVEKLIEPKDVSETGGKQKETFILEENEVPSSVCFSGSVK